MKLSRRLFAGAMIAAGIGLGLAVPQAEAHGPSRQKAAAKATLAASPDEVRHRPRS